MTRLMVGMVGVVVAMGSGCATQMNVQQQAVQIAGKPYTYVMAEGKDPSGVNFVVMDRYDGEGKLVSRDAASGNGILHAVIPAVIDGAATAGGLIGAAAVLRPDTTNVTQTTGGTVDAGASSGNGSDGNSGSGSGGGSGSTTITVSPTVTTSSSASPITSSSSSAKSTATAASASNQSQSQTASSANNNANTNANTNTNSNTNTGKGGGKTKTHTNNGHHYGHDKTKGDK